MQGRRPTNVFAVPFPEGIAPQFDVDAFDDAVRNQGVRLVHYRAMRCPVGLTDMFDVRKPHGDHANCSNGFLYSRAGEVLALFIGNGAGSDHTDLGMMDGSTVHVTTPRFYESEYETEEPRFAQSVAFDRFYLADEAVTVPTWELVEHHVTGVDRTMYPAAEVIDLVDATGKRYEPEVDFQVEGGKIHWGQNSPGSDPDSGKGVIYSVRYQYRPYWYVKQVPHEIRVTRTDAGLDERTLHRMPQNLVLQREYVFEKGKEDWETTGEDSQRQVRTPRDGGFGPR